MYAERSVEVLDKSRSLMLFETWKGSWGPNVENTIKLRCFMKCMPTCSTHAFLIAASNETLHGYQLNSDCWLPSDIQWVIVGMNFSHQCCHGQAREFSFNIARLHSQDNNVHQYLLGKTLFAAAMLNRNRSSAFISADWCQFSVGMQLVVASLFTAGWTRRIYVVSCDMQTIIETRERAS